MRLYWACPPMSPMWAIAVWHGQMRERSQSWKNIGDTLRWDQIQRSTNKVLCTVFPIQHLKDVFHH